MFLAFMVHVYGPMQSKRTDEVIANEYRSFHSMLESGFKTSCIIVSEREREREEPNITGGYTPPQFGWCIEPPENVSSICPITTQLLGSAAV